MKNILIINAHQYYPYSEGKLNATLVQMAKDILEEKEYQVKTSVINDGWDLDEKVEKHLWADHIIVQSPVYWMGTSTLFKKYTDVVISHGRGIFFLHDGRVIDDETKQYGTGGLLLDTSYSLSLTFNAPQKVFNDPQQVFFKGKSVDDLFLPLHLTYQFIGMKPKFETFVCYDVLKNPTIKEDLERFEAYLRNNF